MLWRMDETERLRARWAQFLDRAGAAGRDWRKSMIARADSTEAAVPDLQALKQRIKALRAARAADHWSFQPEQLRALLAAYIRLRAHRSRRPGGH
jgi:hypothetical protein